MSRLPITSKQNSRIRYWMRLAAPLSAPCCCVWRGNVVIIPYVAVFCRTRSKTNKVSWKHCPLLRKYSIDLFSHHTYECTKGGRVVNYLQQQQWKFKCCCREMLKFSWFTDLVRLNAELNWTKFLFLFFFFVKSRFSPCHSVHTIKINYFDDGWIDLWNFREPKEGVDSWRPPQWFLT